MASTDLTGSDQLGGDWDLEYAVGDIEAELAFNAEVNQNYTHILNDFPAGNDLPIFDNGTIFKNFPADVTLPGSDFPSAPARLELNKLIDPSAFFDPSIIENSNFRIDYTPVDIRFVDSEFSSDRSLLDFPQVENQPFSLNFANGNFSWIQLSPDYNYQRPITNSLIFPFDASSLNFNPANFEFTSVSLNEFGALDSDDDSITFKFEAGTFDFTSLTSRSSLSFKFKSEIADFYDLEYDNLIRLGDNVTFDATAVTFRSDSITFDYQPRTLDFNPDSFAANANLYEYKLSASDFNAGVSLEQFNASDYRALDYAFTGDELFDSNYYVNQGATPSGMNPFTDYIENGYQAGRNPNGLFNVNYYLDKNTDVRLKGGDPLTHYATFGGGEIFDSRDPNRLFDSSYYLAKNPDVLAARMNPLLHYIQFGWRESRVDNPGGFNPNRDPSPFFDTSFYFETHVDVRDASFGLSSANALQHYLEFGNNGSVAIENRVTHPIFESENQVSFSTFVDADSASFEFLQNTINSNNYGVRVFRGDDGIRVASAFDEGGFGVGKLIEGFVYTVFSAGAFVLQKSVEGLTELSERAFEAAEDAEIFERITFTPADDTIFTFPGETEGTIIVEEFPVGEPINFDDDVIFSTPLEPVTELSSPNVFPQRDRILEDLLNEPFIFPDEIELPQQFLAIETNPFAAVDKNININLGILRELKVANQVGGFKVVEPGRPNKDLVVRERNNPTVGLSIDVVGANNELILVGGARKSSDLPALKDQLTRLKIIANSRNVTAQAYFAENTPPSAIELAKAELGDIVFTFSDVLEQEINDLIKLPIIKDNIDF